MLKFNSRTGVFTFTDGSTCHAYSGAGIGKNNPTLEAEPNVGPIPAGAWGLGVVYDSPKTGPVTITLIYRGTPGGDHGRSAFRIHGDNGHGTASEGCICFSPRELREKAYNDPDKLLLVSHDD